jgi:hypothetical protein
MSIDKYTDPAALVPRRHGSVHLSSAQNIRTLKGHAMLNDRVIQEVLQPPNT